MIARASAFIEVVSFWMEVKQFTIQLALGFHTSMSGLEINKFAAAILIAGLLALGVGKIANGIYSPVTHPEKRGFEVEVADAGANEGGAAAADTAPVEIASFMATADVAAGQALIKKCATCHDFTKGGPNKVGPNLWGIVGAKHAAHAGFVYSDAMKAIPGNWDEQALSEFLDKPKAYAPGTKMAFAGLKKPEERAAVIAYLKTLK